MRVLKADLVSGGVRIGYVIYRVDEVSRTYPGYGWSRAASERPSTLFRGLSGSSAGDMAWCGLECLKALFLIGWLRGWG